MPPAVRCRTRAAAPHTARLKSDADDAITKVIMVEFSSATLASPADFDAYRIPGEGSIETLHPAPLFPGRFKASRHLYRHSPAGCRRYVPLDQAICKESAHV